MKNEKQIVEQIEAEAKKLYPDDEFPNWGGYFTNQQMAEIEREAYKAGRLKSIDNGGWISVDDELPKCIKQYERIEVSQEVQIFDNIIGVQQAWLKRFLIDSCDALFPERIKGYIMFENGHGSYYNVTHWQPLPSPPQKPISEQNSKS